MFATSLLGAALAAYAAWVIWRKCRALKHGGFCGCGCQGCPAGCRKNPGPPHMEE